MDSETVNPLNCRDITTRIALGDLEQSSWTRRLAIRFHLAICWLCRKYERQLRVISKAYAMGQRQQFNLAASTSLKARLFDALRR